MPKSGRFIGADGQVYNLVDLLGGASPLSDKQYDIGKYAPSSGLIIGEDGHVYSLVDLLSNVGNGEGGGGGEEFDGTVLWGNITNKPQTYPPSEHNHDDRYYTKEEATNHVNFVRDLMEQEQGKIAAHVDDEPAYLDSKVDNVTAVVEGNELKVKSIDGLTIGVASINSWLSGTEDNIQTQIDSINDSLVALSSGMRYMGKFETYADLQNVSNTENGDLAVVLADENRSGGRSMYVYSDNFGMWEFIGEFTFNDEFLAFQDTPDSYADADGKVVRVAGERLVFDDVDYANLANKPSSTITQIDDAVAKRHEHNNADSLAKLGVNSDGELTINGVVYAPKTEMPVKHRLYARRTGTEQSLTAGTDCVFNTKYGGSGIPYNTSTGVFTLEAGKTYRVFVTASINTEGYVILHLVSASNNAVTSDNNRAIWMSVTPSNTNWKESSAGPLLAYITPAVTEGFKIRATSVSGVSALRHNYCALEITEI